MNYSVSGDGPELPSIFVGRTSGRVNDGLVLPNGTVMLGGDFGTVGGQNCKAIAAFSSEGVWLPNSAPTLAGGVFATPEVKSFAMTQDGVMVAGNFDTIGGRNLGHVAKLGFDGKVDTSFTTSLTDDTRAVAVRCDGMMAGGGVFSFIKGVRRSSVAQFYPGAPTAIRMVAPVILPNGQAVVRSGVVPGKRYTMESSSDLIHWSVLKTIVPTYTLDQWTDPAATSVPNRFYRLTEK